MSFKKKERKKYPIKIFGGKSIHLIENAMRDEAHLIFTFWRRAKLRGVHTDFVLLANCELKFLLER